MTRRAAVLGASGFVGHAVCQELQKRGWEVTALAAPRLASTVRQLGALGALGSAERQRAEATEALALQLDGMDALVNAAGLATPTGQDLEALAAANAVLPRIAAAACALALVPRLVHVSSAAVQGDLLRLDESVHYRADSAYARSKMLGEEALRAPSGTQTPGQTVVLRPTSVHGAGRAVTRRLVQLARSPLACVLAPGHYPTPQVLVDNVGAAAEYLCRAEVTPPPIVLQPWEGWTTGSFLELLSGRAPRQVPDRCGRPLLRLAGATCGRGSRLAYRRRLELLWCGQAQVPGWLAGAGFTPPYGRDEWDRLVCDAGGGRH